MAKTTEELLAEKIAQQTAKGYVVPKTTEVRGIVAAIKQQSRNAKDNHEYTQYVVTLTNGKTYFFNYAITANIGDHVILFGVQTEANVTGYSSNNTEVLDMPHTTTGFVAKSIVADLEAKAASMIFITEKAKASAQLSAKKDFVAENQSNEILQAAWKAFGF